MMQPWQSLKYSNASTCLMEKLLDGRLLRVEEQCSHVVVVGRGLGVAVGRAEVVLGLVSEGRHPGLEGGKVRVWEGVG